jgi:hypothetical protein
VACRGRDRGLAAADRWSSSSTHQRALRHGPGGNRAPLEAVLLPPDALQLARLALLVADEDLDLIGESQEAAVEGSLRSIAGGLR